MLTESEVSAILPNWEKLDWYYSFELYPGIYTKGLDFSNIALTRRMLDTIDLNGTNALDVGAMEGAMSTIMAKRGARVLAADAIDLADRVTLVKRAQGVHFSYFPDMPLHRFAERIFEIQASKTTPWRTLTLEREHYTVAFSIFHLEEYFWLQRERDCVSADRHGVRGVFLGVRRTARAADEAGLGRRIEIWELVSCPRNLRNAVDRDRHALGRFVDLDQEVGLAEHPLCKSCGRRSLGKPRRT